MKYDPDKHHRRSMRLHGYDYTQAGAYYVTICAQDRACLFGSMANDDMQSSDAGRMVKTTWTEIPGHYTGIDIGAFKVMPNHIHGILLLVGAGPCARPGPEPGQPQGVAPTLSLPDHQHSFSRREARSVGLCYHVDSEGWEH